MQGKYRAMSNSPLGFAVRRGKQQGNRPAEPRLTMVHSCQMDLKSEFGVGVRKEKD